MDAIQTLYKASTSKAYCGMNSIDMNLHVVTEHTVKHLELVASLRCRYKTGQANSSISEHPIGQCQAGEHKSRV